MLNDKWLIIAFLSISLNICAETSSAIDTINFIGNPKKIKLKNQFIVASSLEFIGSKTKVNPIEIRPIKGEVFLEASIIAQQIIIKYDYLNNKLPLSVGPKWKMLPQLDLQKRMLTK